MSSIKFYKHEQIPVEMHKVKIVQKLNLAVTRNRLNSWFVFRITIFVKFHQTLTLYKKL